MANLAEVLKSALDLEVEDRAALAERRLEQLRDGRGRTVAAAEVHKKAERLLR